MIGKSWDSFLHLVCIGFAFLCKTLLETCRARRQKKGQEGKRREREREREREIGLHYAAKNT